MRILRNERGFALTDVVAGMTVLAFVVLSVMNVFLAGFTQASTSHVQSEAGVWVQAEIDYLRGIGYTHACLAAGTRTITPTSPSCTGLEPSLPADFAQATVQVEDNALGETGLKRVTIEVVRNPGTVFYRMATYVTEFE